MKSTKPKRFSFDNLSNWIPLQSLLGDLSHAVSIERFGPRLSRRVLWRAPGNVPKVALTFDDGPHASSTPRILDALHRHQVKATFFLVGKHIESNPTVAQDIVKAGHEVGNHTFHHSLLFLLSNNQILSEITRADELIRSLNGTEPRFLRPPVGLFTKRMLNIAEQLGYQTVVGDVYPRDPHRPGKEKIIKRVLTRTSAGSVIILHDGGNSRRVDRSQTLEALHDIIPGLIERELEFVTLSDLFQAHPVIRNENEN